MRGLRATILLAFLLLAACDAEKAGEEVTAAQVRIYLFDCGGIRFDDVTAFSIANDETDVRELAVPCYVIEHDNGRLLWDGGLPSSIAETEGWQGEGFQMRLNQTLGAQLKGIGLDMSSFDYAAFSHMHLDHVGVANELAGATLLIQQPEYDAAFADEVTIPVFDPALYSNLRAAETVFLDGDHDVFGDGRVRIIAAPGHTPGHQVLLVELAEYGPVLLSGDLYHFEISRADRRVPEWNVDREQTLASMDRVEAVIAETGATLWIEHDLATFKRLDKGPAFYE